MPCFPRRAVAGNGRPSFMINAAVAHHLEVLCLVLFFRFRIVKCICHGDTFHGLLHDAVDKRRLRKTRHFQYSWSYIYDVRELASNLSFCLNSAGPMNDGSITCTAPMRGYLFGPLI